MRRKGIKVLSEEQAIGGVEAFHQAEGLLVKPAEGQGSLRKHHQKQGKELSHRAAQVDQIGPKELPSTPTHPPKFFLASSHESDCISNPHKEPL
jgi:hypothetical protein